MTRRITALLALASAGLCFVPIARAASTVSLQPIAEAWFQSDPTCGTPAGCLTTALPVPLPDVPVSIYPARSMHVAVSGGVESARSYVALSTAGLAGELVSSSITVPLDTSPSSGSITPEKAKVQVCLFRGPAPAAEGSLATPPPADCSSNAILSYNALPAAHLEGDIDALLPGLRSATGIVLMPDATNTQPTDAWHIAFSAHDRSDAGKTSPLSLTVTTADAAPSQPEGLPQVSTPEPLTPPVVAGPPALGIPQVSEPVEQPAAPPAVAGPVTSLPRTVTIGYQYPVVWLFPLLMLGVVPAIARLLTRDMTPTRFQA